MSKMPAYHFYYSAAHDMVYENDQPLEGLTTGDLHTLSDLVYDACHSRFEYEGQEVRYNGVEWVITEQETNVVWYRASSPGQALRWLLGL